MPTTAAPASSKPLPRQTLFGPLCAADVEAVAEETSAHEANRMLQSGWRLLQVIHAQDGGGGYPAYVVGKPRVLVDATH